MAERIETVAVYCGSNRGKGDAYAEAAAGLGRAIAARGMTLVYGGTHKGTMGVLADAAIGAGGIVHGMITARLADRGHLHPGLHHSEVLPTMSARKARMIARADAFVALPGGIGTLEEFMEAWTLNQLGEMSKPLGLLDGAGFYGPFVGFIEHMITEGFLPPAHRDGIVVSPDAESLLDGLAAWSPVTVPKWMS